MTYWLIGRLAAGTVLAALAAGCGSSTPAAHAPSAAPAASVPASSAGAATGPFKIKVLYCGPFSKAQQNQNEDYSGLIFKYTNVSNSVVGSPVLSVNFTKGSTVTGSNVNGSEPNISPGQSATADVGAVGDGGQTLKFTGCQPVSCGVQTPAGDLPGTYTP
jgi:hypothetical protein